MCILVVEDEPLIRLIVVEELTDHGYEVCEAETGDMAARILEAGRPCLSMLITDLHMPGKLDGFAVATLVRERYPLAPIILTTGRPDLARDVFTLRDNETLLSKPFLPSQLVAAVRHLLVPSPSGLSGQ